jgi:hypothetical protein
MELFLDLLFGAVGTVYLGIARRERDVTYLITGFVLIGYPYFVSNLFLIVVIGVVVGAYPILHARGMI